MNPNTSYQNKIKALRKIMKDSNVQGYLVPRTDEYQGEFVAPYAERLKWLTGFSGSAGCALIFESKAFLITDGRYTLQAKNQTDPKLYETGDYIKKQLGEWILENAEENAVIGYDPRLHTPAQIEKIESEARTKSITLKPLAQNLIDAIWDDQPQKPKGAVSLFPEDVAGHSVAKKCTKIGEIIAQQEAAACLITLPESVCWLLNVRGADIEYVPSILCVALIDAKGKVSLFIEPEKVSDNVRASFGKTVQVHPPEALGVQLMALAQDSEAPVLIDERFTPVYYKSLLTARGLTIKNAPDPTIRPKSIKTPSEQESIRKAHIADGAALVKFLKWLDEEAPKGTQSEISVAEKLKEFRAQHKAFKGNSFPTIAGYGPNGAIIHYRASEESNAAITNGNLLLLDSGGQYCAGDIVGTTDITRTIGIGEVDSEIKENFTRVLKGHIALAMAKFPGGTLGAQIDTLARKSLWDAGLDYAHGTGHGVGCYLAVHEEAANISSRGQTPFEPGMLISNEPGYYKEGAYGIRIENLVLVIELENKMLSFETVSYAPIDQTLILTDILSAEEKSWLNEYHKTVLEKLSPLLDEPTQDWLKDKTRPL